MPVLSDDIREGIWSDFMQTVPGTIGACTKADLRDAVNALDDWITNSAPTLDQGIPEPARSALDPHQKTKMFLLIVEKRYAEGM
jgi:hypothetical protein